MEPDRFSQNEVCYILGVICVAIGLILFSLSFYIFPYLILDWHYTVPDFVPSLVGDLQGAYQLETKAVGWLVFLGMFFPSLILLIVADILSNKIDSKIHGDKIVKKDITKGSKPSNMPENSSMQLVMKIILIIVLVFIATKFFHWALSTSPI